MPLDINMASDGEPGLLTSPSIGSSAIVVGEPPPSFLVLLPKKSGIDERLAAESKLSHDLDSSAGISVISGPSD
jgi:hypothetical protein